MGRQAHFPLLPTCIHYIPLSAPSQYFLSTYPQIKTPGISECFLVWNWGRAGEMRAALVKAGFVMFVATGVGPNGPRKDDDDHHRQSYHPNKREDHELTEFLHRPSKKVWTVCTTKPIKNQDQYQVLILFPENLFF